LYTVLLVRPTTRAISATAVPSAASLRTRASFSSLPLTGGDLGQDREDHATCRRVQVEAVADRVQADAEAPELLEELQQAKSRAAEAIEAPDDDLRDFSRAGVGERTIDQMSDEELMRIASGREE
jgi:hypothetical protein